MNASMNATTHFPWAIIVSNAVWICGLAVILAALGWHDYKRRERKERNLKVAVAPQDKPSLKAVAKKRVEPLMKPVIFGSIMIAGGLTLSVRGAFLAAALATASFALIFIFIKKVLRQA